MEEPSGAVAKPKAQRKPPAPLPQLDRKVLKEVLKDDKLAQQVIDAHRQKGKAKPKGAQLIKVTADDLAATFDLLEGKPSKQMPRVLRVVRRHWAEKPAVQSTFKAYAEKLYEQVDPAGWRKRQQMASPTSNGSTPVPD